VREYERLASAYIASYDTKSALVTIEKALEEEPTARLLSLKGDLHYMDKDYEQAFEAFRECAAHGDDSGRSYLMMGYCAMEMARYEEAIEQLEHAADYPDQHETALQLVKRARLMNGLVSDTDS
jgi:tetratricopeptide (TPR) repeat protein